MEFKLPIHHTFEYKGTDMELQLSSYPGGSPKVTILSYEEGPYASLGKPSFPVLEGNEMVLHDTFIEHQKIITKFIEDGIFSKTGKTINSGYETFGVYTFNGVD